MKRKKFPVDFTLGLNQNDSPKFMKDGECQIAQDCDFDTLGSIFTRKFKVNHISFDSKPKSIFNYSNIVTHLESGGLYDSAKLIGSGYGSQPFTGMEYNDVLYIVNGANELRYNRSNVYAMGNAYPTVKPTVTTLPAGVLDGEYYYKYTYVDVYGKESAYSPVSDAVNPSSQKVNVAFTTSGESKITHVNIYRLGGTLTDWYYVTQVAKAATPYVDNNADSALTTLADADNNYPPQGFNFLIEHYDRGIGAKTTTYPNGIWWSVQYEPEYWGSSSTAQNYLLGDINPCTGLVSWQSVITFFKKHRIHVMEGTDPSQWFKRVSNSNFGNIAPYCIDVYITPIFCYYDGLYAFDGYSGQEFTQKVRKFFLENKGYLENAVGAVHDKKYYFGIEDKTLVYDFVNKRFYTYNFGMTAIKNDKLNDVLYAGVGNNLVKLEQDLNDSNETVNFQLKSKMYSLNDVFGDTGELYDYNLTLNTQGEDVTFNVYINQRLKQQITLNTKELKKIDGGFNVTDGEFAEFEFVYNGTKQIQIDIPLQINPNADSGL